MGLQETSGTQSAPVLETCGSDHSQENKTLSSPEADAAASTAQRIRLGGVTCSDPIWR